MTRFANRWDVDDLVEFTDDGSTPNAHRLALTLRNLRDWADDNSDGWSSWPKPSRAASTIVERLENLRADFRRGGFIVDLDDATTTKALTPVKAFLTRQGIEHATIIHSTTTDELAEQVALEAATTTTVPHLLEAVCGECAETFIPADEDDLEHGEREDGTPCGGPGIIVGAWHFTPTTGKA